MDTEEDFKIQTAQHEGRPETDEGPHYHVAWWEAYKGGVKGKLGGLILGALIGGMVGVLTASVLAIASIGAVSLATGVAITAGFAAGGMLYGAHEFSDVGKVTGAVAAAHEISEHRMKGKFAEIKQELSDIKTLLTGKKIRPHKKTAAQEAAGEETHSHEYRTKHCDDHCPPNGRKWIFWKVAAIGTVIGVLAGALLAFGGLSEHVFHALGAAGEPLHHAGVYLASMAGLGAFGFSFGVNRDLAREVFDKTDLAFRGIIRNGKHRGKQVETSHESCQDIDKKADKFQKLPVATIVYSGHIDYPQSDTYFQSKEDERKKILKAAKEALLELDHQSAVRQ